LSLIYFGPPFSGPAFSVNPSLPFWSWSMCLRSLLTSLPKSCTSAPAAPVGAPDKRVQWLFAVAHGRCGRCGIHTVGPWNAKLHWPIIDVCTLGSWTHPDDAELIHGRPQTSSMSTHTYSMFLKYTSTLAAQGLSSPESAPLHFLNAKIQPLCIARISLK